MAVQVIRTCKKRVAFGKAVKPKGNQSTVLKRLFCKKLFNGLISIGIPEKDQTPSYNCASGKSPPGDR